MARVVCSFQTREFDGGESDIPDGKVGRSSLSPKSLGILKAHRNTCGGNHCKHVAVGSKCALK